MTRIKTICVFYTLSRTNLRNVYINLQYIYIILYLLKYNKSFLKSNNLNLYIKIIFKDLYLY